MKVLHLLSAGGVGGIEVLCKEIARHSIWKNEFCCLFSGGIIADEIKMMGIKTYDFYGYNHLKKLFRLVKLCKKEKYQVIIEHHEGISIQVYYILLSKLVKGPMYIRGCHSSFNTMYTTEGNGLKAWLNWMTLALTMRASKKIFAVSQYVAKSYQEQFRKVDIQCIYNGVSSELIAQGAASTNVKRENKISLLYIGRIAQIKGIHLLIEAMEIVVKKNPEVSLQIVGEGEYSDTCKELVKKKQLEEYVTLRGQQRELVTFFQEANIFVYPSICQEAFGISIIEAMAYGLLCVATPVGGIPEIITDGKNGFLTQGISKIDIANGIIKAINCFSNEQKRGNLEENAKARAKDFTIEQTIEGMGRLFLTK